MSTLLFTGEFRGEAPSDEGDVRSTITVVDHESPDAVADHRPDFNSNETDPDTEGGLTTRDVADWVSPSQQYKPIPGNANTDFSALDSRISAVGTAAQREEAGQWGHGSQQWSDATEPTIREGAAFDDVYFSASRPPIQDGTLDYMLPSRRPDTQDAESVQRAVQAAQRKATQAALYQTFLERTGS